MLDYRPDLDPRTPGLLVELRNMLPTARGYRAGYALTAHTAHTYSLAANETYPNACFASRWLSTPGGIVIVGTNQKLNVYDYTNGFINVSKAGNYSLAGGTFQYGEDGIGAFDMCAFGDALIACHKSTATQLRSALDLTIATLFADLGGNSPAAQTCCVASNFVFLGNVGNWSTGPTITGANNMLVWSAIGDHLTWTNNPTVTQCSYAVFSDTPGAITAVRPFRDGVVVFKAESMYLGRYVGAGTNSPIWDFVRVSDKVGCVGHRSIADIDSALVFLGRNDIYSYDGTRPVSITNGVFGAISSEFDNNGKNPMVFGHDKPNSQVMMSSTGFTWIWNYRYNRWGKQTYGQAIHCQTNADDFRKITLSSVSSGTQVYTTTTNHYNLYNLFFNGSTPYNRQTTRSDSTSLTTGAIGGPDKVRTLTRVNPIFVTRPSTVATATLEIFASRTPGSFASLGTATMGSGYRFDTLNIAGVSNNFLQFKLNCTQDFELIGLDTDPNLIPAGAR